MILNVINTPQNIITLLLFTFYEYQNNFETKNETASMLHYSLLETPRSFQNKPEAHYSSMFSVNQTHLHVDQSEESELLKQ